MCADTHKIIIKETIVKHYDFTFNIDDYKDMDDGAKNILGMFEDAQGEWEHGEVIENKTKILSVREIEDKDKVYTYRLRAVAGKLKFSFIFNHKGPLIRGCREYLDIINDFLKSNKTRCGIKIDVDGDYDSIIIEECEEN